MEHDDDVLTGIELDHEREQRALGALTDGNYRTAERPSCRTTREIRALQEQLQLLADRPQLRHRLGYGRVNTTAPYADSRRSTDSNDGSRRYVMDNRSRAGDNDRNYAAGLL
jgi:hypothetical protein